MVFECINPMGHLSAPDEWRQQTIQVDALDWHITNEVFMIHPDLIEAQKLAYMPSGITSHSFSQERESEEYGAFDFEMKGHRIKFRVGKMTPTKTGQFVTLWKRIGKGPILPYDRADPVDLFVISVRKLGYFGQFVFPKSVLCEKGIVSEGGQGGKRAMRVYPPWDSVESRQAKSTQAWQLLYFFEIPSNTGIDVQRICALFS